MGFKSKNNQSNICKRFRVGGLTFDSEEDYLNFKRLDEKIKQVVQSVKDGSIDLKDYFDNIKSINIEENYPDAREELDGLFKNATDLIIYKDIIFDTENKVGRCFFNKINVVEYSGYKVDSYFFDNINELEYSDIDDIE